MTISRTNAGPGLAAGLPFGLASEFPDTATAPARFTFQAGARPFGAKIEIQAVAARGT